MKNFFIVIVFGYIITTLTGFYYNGISIDSLIKSLQMYTMLHFGAFFSFLNLFHLKTMSNILIAIAWVLTLCFAYYIYKYTSGKLSLYLWCIFMLFWLLIGLYNPDFRA